MGGRRLGKHWCCVAPLIIHWAGGQSGPIHFQVSIAAPGQPITWLEFRDFLVEQLPGNAGVSDKLLFGEEPDLLETKAVFFLEKRPEAPL